MSDEPRQQRFEFGEEPAEPTPSLGAAPPDDAPPDDAPADDVPADEAPADVSADATIDEVRTAPASPEQPEPPRPPEPPEPPRPPERREPPDALDAPSASASPLAAAPPEHLDAAPTEPPAPAGAERPAPVVTEEGEFWFAGAEEEALARRELRAERWTPLRHAGAWVAGLALVAVAAGTLGAHSVVQATGEEVALPALRRAIGALAQPEALLELHREELAEAAAGAASPEADVELPGYPVVGVALTAEEAGSGDLERMRDALLERSAALVHAEGRVALAEGGLAPPASDRLSTAGAVAGLLDGLTAENHDRWSGWRTALVALAALLGAAVLALPRGFGGVLGLGAALLAAGLVVAGAALGLRVALSLAGGEGPLLDEYLRISRELTSIPLRNGLVLAASGVALALPAALLRALFERSVTRESPRAAGREIEL